MIIKKSINGYSNKYVADSMGNIYNKKGVMKVRPNNSGYYLISLWDNGIRKVLLVHRIIAKTFIPNNENKRFVNHKDGNKLNNNINNLEWVTNSENMRHASKIGLLKGNRTPGFSRPFTKLTIKDIKEIRDLYGYYNFRELGELYGVCKSNIEFIVKRQTWRYVN